MKKRFFYLGIVLVVVAFIAFFFAVPALAVPSQLTNVTPKSVAIAAGSFAYLPIFLNSTGIITVGYNASSQLSFYLANASAEGAITNASSQNSSVLQEATALEGNGVYLLYSLSSKGVYPYYANYSSALQAPDYQANITPMPSGHYYAGFYNPGNSVVTAAISAEPITLTQLESASGSIGTGMLAVGIIFIIGIALIVYSIFAKPKQPMTPGALSEEVTKAYDQIEKKQGGGTAKSA